MTLTDTHTHLYAAEFDIDRDLILKAAIEQGIKRFFLPNIDSTTVDSMLELEKTYPGICFPMMGLHPCSVKANWKEELQSVETQLNKRKFAAVGEMGIDLYWDKTFLNEQKTVFTEQVKLANQYKLPIVIHSRESFEEIYQLLLQTKKETPRGIFHCFTGNLEQAQRAIDLGFLLGIGGVLTFKNSGLDKVITEVDLKYLVLETDGPYLAPAPHRGKRNIPEYILLVAQKLAAIKQVSVEEIAMRTTENSKAVFGM